MMNPYLMMKRETLFLVVRMFSDSSTFVIAVGPFPSLQRESILSLAYSLKTMTYLMNRQKNYTVLYSHMGLC